MKYADLSEARNRLVRKTAAHILDTFFLEQVDKAAQGQMARAKLDKLGQPARAVILYTPQPEQYQTAEVIVGAALYEAEGLFGDGDDAENAK